MEARQRWDSLQAHLTAARTACDAGDRDRALEHVDAALAIDPSFLAAHWLRERVLALQGFDDDPKASNEPKLEAIQMAWYEEYKES